MQFTTALVALFAAVAVAAPAPWHAKSTPAANQCADNQEQACCNSSDDKPTVGAQCAVQLLGGACSGSTQCCESDGKGGLLGLGLCVPIQL